MRGIFEWINETNFPIDPNFDVKVSPSRQGQGLLDVIQEPAGSQIFQVVMTVDPARGYIALTTDVVDPKSGVAITHYEAQDVRQIAPGIWRPFETTLLRYALSSRPDGSFVSTSSDGKPAVQSSQNLKVVEVQAVNLDVDPRQFDPVLPPKIDQLVKYDINGKREFVVNPQVGTGGVADLPAALAQAKETTQPVVSNAPATFSHTSDARSYARAALIVAIVLVIGVLAYGWSRVVRKGGNAAT